MTGPHTSTLVAGAIFTALGVAFILEAVGAWTFRLTDLRVVGPLALILVGVAILASTAASRKSQA